MSYEAVIGLEVHLHLSTKTKAFCGCPTEFGQQPNSQVCPICLGFPGSLPVYNKVALGYAIKVALALNCQIQEFTKFDRKHYYYPDLPKNFQISQYDLPLSRDGFLEVGSRRIAIRRVHMEEDAGKLIHKDECSLIDFNRTGVPLLEIVSEPDIYSPEEAYAYLTALKGVLEYLEVSDCDMEKGSLRCDANVSVRKQGEGGLGTKIELKNMNSFKAVKDALAFEVTRQIDLLEDGKTISQETRLWNVLELKTFPMRSKEEAKDYRYFPEPDLLPFVIAPETISQTKASIPELPREKKARFMKEYALLEYDAGILVSSKKDAEYAEECLRQFPGNDKKPVANWLIGPLLSEANVRNCSMHELAVPAGDLVELVGFLQRQEISNLSAKQVLSEMVETKKSPETIIKEKNLIQVSDQAGLEAFVQEVLKEHAKSAQDYKAGKASALSFLVGQVMRKSQGKANPKAVGELLKRRLDDA